MIFGRPFKDLVPAVLDIVGLSVILNVEVWEYFIF